jgi:hypothetical protein
MKTRKPFVLAFGVVLIASAAFAATLAYEPYTYDPNHTGDVSVNFANVQNRLTMLLQKNGKDPVSQAGVAFGGNAGPNPISQIAFDIAGISKIIPTTTTIVNKVTTTTLGSPRYMLEDAQHNQYCFTVADLEKYGVSRVDGPFSLFTCNTASVPAANTKVGKGPAFQPGVTIVSASLFIDQEQDDWFGTLWINGLAGQILLNR